MLLPGEIIVDNFAGGGGASLGIEQATGRPIDVAINHDEYAVAMHRANHPHTLHYCQSVTKADPLDVAAGRPVGLAWFSPDCTHFSKARGGRPKKKYIRDLAHVVVLWAQRVKPRIIGLENVGEFRKWGPLDEEGQPIKERECEEFDKWIKDIRRAGYKVEWRELIAADFGAPTTRKRLFLIARRDGQPIAWPEPTHGKPDDPDVIAGRKLPWLSAASIIDWSIPCPSIFLTREEALTLRRTTGIRCNRPLADKTMLRIARGLKRFVIDAKEPFIVKIENYGWDAMEKGVSDPLSTITASPKGGKHALVTPFTTAFYGTKGDTDLRVPDIKEPLRTQTASGNRFALVHAFLAKHYGGATGQTLEKPFPTVTQRGTQNQIVSVHLDPQYGRSRGSDVEAPLPTVKGGGGPALVASHLTKFKGTCAAGHATHEPLATVQAQGQHFGEVRAFLTKYYGEGGQLSDLSDPLHSLTAKGRMGLVVVEGIEYQISDIGMRMLKPRELFNSHGFVEDYKLDAPVNGKPMGVVKQVEMCGNSAPPPVVKALVGINVVAPVMREAAE